MNKETKEEIERVQNELYESWRKQDEHGERIAAYVTSIFVIIVIIAIYKHLPEITKLIK